MGLFSKFKKETDTRSLRECLEVCPVYILYEEARLSITPLCSPSEPDEYAPVALCTRTEVGMIGKYNREFKGMGFTIPAQYREEYICITELLEIAAEKGHANSAFLLSFIYRFGLDKLSECCYTDQYTPADMYKNRDVEKADAYLELACSRDCRAAKAYRWIEENVVVPDDEPIDRAEAIAMLMMDCDAPGIQTALEEDYEYTSFMTMGFWLLCGLCQYGFAYAMGLLIALTNAVLTGEVDMAIFDESFCRQRADWPGVIQNIHERLLRRARMGDASALHTVQKFGL